MSAPTPLPTTNNPFIILSDDDDDNVTVAMSNLSSGKDVPPNDDATATTTTTNTTDDEFLGNESPHVPPIHPCDITLPTNQQAWCNLVQQQQLHDLPNASTIFDAQKLQKTVRYALFHLGAAAHFLVEGAPVTNKKVATAPITITLPDGSQVLSSHTCNLDIPWLPDSMTEAHIVPQLAHSSLISTRKFCDAGCQVTFDENECRVYYNKELVLVGDRGTKSNLWRLPINPIAKPTSNPTLQPLDLHVEPTQPITHSAFNLYIIPHRQIQLKYMHQCFLSPAIDTILRAVQNHQLENIPFMKSKLVQKHLAKSQATSKGHMKHHRAGIRSIRPKQNTSKIQVLEPVSLIHPNAQHTTPKAVPITIPHKTHEVSNIFCFAALANKQNGTFYTDATGALPTVSLDGNQYYFVAYDYDTNYIFAIPIKDVKDVTLVAACKEVLDTLRDKGYKPTLNITDNQAARPLKDYLKTEECAWHFVEQANHCVNAA